MKIIILFAGFFLPYWCYLSYRSVFVQFDYQTLLVGGCLAEVSHLIVFRTAMQHLEKPWCMVLFIASILFFVETAAFLGVVTAFRPRGHVTIPNGHGPSSTLNDENPREWHLDSTSPLVWKLARPWGTTSCNGFTYIWLLPHHVRVGKKQKLNALYTPIWFLFILVCWYFLVRRIDRVW